MTTVERQLSEMRKTLVFFRTHEVPEEIHGVSSPLTVSLSAPLSQNSQRAHPLKKTSDTPFHPVRVQEGSGWINFAVHVSILTHVVCYTPEIIPSNNRERMQSEERPLTDKRSSKNTAYSTWRKSKSREPKFVHRRPAHRCALDVARVDELVKYDIGEECLVFEGKMRDQHHEQSFKEIQDKYRRWLLGGQSIDRAKTVDEEIL